MMSRGEERRKTSISYGGAGFLENLQVFEENEGCIRFWR